MLKQRTAAILFLVLFSNFPPFAIFGNVRTQASAFLKRRCVFVVYRDNFVESRESS